MHGCTYSSLKYIKRPTILSVAYRVLPLTLIDGRDADNVHKQALTVMRGALAAEPLKICLMELKVDKNQE